MLFVVRHAESVENATKHGGFYRDPRPYSGAFAYTLSREIVGLTPRGFRQAVWLGTVLPPKLGAEPAVYTSTYRRAIDTASLAFPDLHDGLPRQSALLDEQHYGEATYMTKRELFAAYPDSAEERRTRKHEWTAPSGECLASHVVRRARAFIDDVSDATDTVAVTHQTTIIALRSLLEDAAIPALLAREKQRKTPNAAVFAYERVGSRFELRGVIDPPI